MKPPSVGFVRSPPTDPAEVGQFEAPRRMSDPMHAIFVQHHAFVCRTLRYVGVAPSSVEDAAQDVFVVLHRRLGEWDGERDLRSWLWGIARGVASTYRRSAARAERPRDIAPAEPDPSPLEHVDRRERAAFVQRFVDALPEGQRDVFVLVELEGMSAPEVVELLEIELNTVYSRLRTARERFRRALEQRNAQDRQRCHG